MSIAAPACVCPSHLANGAQVLTPLPILPRHQHQHQHPSTAGHPPSLAAQPAMWTAAPVCALPKAPANGAPVPRHPAQVCHPQPQPQCPHPVPSKADHLRCPDAPQATRTAAHVFAFQKPLASGAQGPPCQSRHQHQSPRDPSRADPREFQGAHVDTWIAAPACASCRPPVSIALVPAAHVAWKTRVTALKVWSNCSREVIGLLVFCPNRL
mmetsp:Transcript_87750/g.139344  ORF Transcript_87750/g.139344 Transcript_87750/m.139344 type:complete len:211 (-) Transcript_87750:51-683(-)